MKEDFQKKIERVCDICDRSVQCPLARQFAQMGSAASRIFLYLATERGLSENYQLLTRRSLENFADWSNNQKQLTSPHQVELSSLSQSLATEKERGLAAGSMKLVVVA